MHCEEGKNDPELLFCEGCASLLTLLDTYQRCKGCFGLGINSETKLCGICERRRPLFEGVAASFDYVGPAATLVKCIKYAQMPYLAKSSAAWMTAQLIKLGWPIPDMIVPVPIAANHKLQRGYNQSFLLAENLAKNLNTELKDLLVRESGDFSQAGLTKNQRVRLTGKKFKAKNHYSWRAKVVLLVDDVMTTGSTLHTCAEVLSGGSPKKIYALSLCRAL